MIVLTFHRKSLFVRRKRSLTGIRVVKDIVRIGDSGISQVFWKWSEAIVVLLLVFAAFC